MSAGPVGGRGSSPSPAGSAAPPGTTAGVGGGEVLDDLAADRLAGYGRSMEEGLGSKPPPQYETLNIPAPEVRPRMRFFFLSFLFRHRRCALACVSFLSFFFTAPEVRLRMCLFSFSFPAPEVRPRMCALLKCMAGVNTRRLG